MWGDWQHGEIGESRQDGEDVEEEEQVEDHSEREEFKRARRKDVGECSFAEQLSTRVEVQMISCSERNSLLRPRAGGREGEE